MSAKNDYCSLSNISGKNTDNNQVILAGNPNVGKSVVFTALTGIYVEASNYPGTTVDIYKAKYGNTLFIDTPGIYGVGDYNEEEIVTRNILVESENVINVVGASSLERDLFLTQQLIDMGFKVIVILNQMDEAAVKGISIDVEMLSRELGVDVFPTIATKKVGIDEIKSNMNFKEGSKTPILEELVSGDLLKIPQRDAVLYLEGDSKATLQYQNSEVTSQKDLIYNERRKHVNQIVSRTVHADYTKASLSSKIGHLLLNPFIGSFVAILVILALYQFVGVFVAGDIVGITEGFITESYIPWFQSIIKLFHPPAIVYDVIAGEFGLLTMTIQYLFGVIIPLVTGFYIFFALLEDSGYLPRLAVLVDKLFNKIGLNGKAIIPLILGFGCVTMGIISSRILNSKRERIIAIALLAVTIPCSAQLAIIVALLASTTSFLNWVIYLITIISIMTIISTLLNRFIEGESSPLVLDLPPIRVPKIRNVLTKSINKTWLFIYEAFPMFLAGSLILSILDLSGALTKIQDLFSPVVVNFLHLPKEVTNTFIMGLIRRDFGASGLADLTTLGHGKSILSNIQIVVSCVVITLFVPCIAAVMVIFKERGFIEAVGLWIFSILIAVLTGGLLSFLLGLMN